MPQYELDFEVVYEAARKTYANYSDAEQDVYETFREVSNPIAIESTNILGRNIMNIDVIDRALYLKSLKHVQSLSKLLCKKYGFTSKEE